MAYVRNLVVFFAVAICIDGEICTKDVCKFQLTVMYRRSMTYTSPNGKTYNVELNNTNNKLQIVGNSFHTDDPLIGTNVSPNDVITLDGVPRNVIVINGQFPGPALEVMEGAKVQVIVHNKLYTSGLSIHWHGMHMVDNQWMDGVAYITQCPIPAQKSFTYRFIASPAGTHWYHSHFQNQRLDGLYGSLIVHKEKPALPYHIIMLQDWSYADADTLQLTNPSIGEPKGTGENLHITANIPERVDGTRLPSNHYISTLINGRGRIDQNEMIPISELKVNQNKSYIFRIIHTGADFEYEVNIDNHKLTILSSDGQSIIPIVTDSLIIYPGERYDVQIDTTQHLGNYWVRADIMNYKSGIYDHSIVPGLSVLAYEEGNGEISSEKRNCTENNRCTVFNCQFRNYAAHDYKDCITFDEAKSLAKEPDDKFGTTDTEYEEIFLNWGFNYGSSVNARNFVKPVSPLVGNYTESIVPCNDKECELGCSCTYILALPYNKTIQMVMISYMPERDIVNHHSIHLHGHNFAVMKMGFPNFNQSTGKAIAYNQDILCDTDDICSKASWNGSAPDLNVENPPIKDSVIVPARGYTVIRFKTLNPGFWFFHCHMERHAIQGMAMVINEAPEHHQPVPSGFPDCGDFTWSIGDFDSYLSKKGAVTNVKHINNTNNSQPTLPETMHDQIALETDVFIGAMVGFVALGAFLATLPLLCYLCLVRRKEYNFK